MIMRFTYVTGVIEEVEDFYTALHHMISYDVVEIHVINTKTGESKIFSLVKEQKGKYENSK